MLVSLSFTGRLGQEPAGSHGWGEGGWSPSSVPDHIPTAPSRGWRQRCRNWGHHFCFVPQLVPPRNVGTEGIRGKPDIPPPPCTDRTGSILTSSDSTPFSVLLHHKHQSAHRWRVACANNPGRWLLLLSPFMEGDTESWRSAPPKGKLWTLFLRFGVSQGPDGLSFHFSLSLKFSSYISSRK